MLSLRLFVIVCSCLAAGAASAAGFQVQPVGVRVAASAPEDELRVYDGAGLSLVLRVSGGPGAIVQVDGDAFAKGATLSAQDGKALPLEVWPFFSYSADRGVVQIEVRSSEAPPAGMSTLQLRGKLPVRTATGRSELRVNNIALAKGEVIQAGDLSMRITGADKPQWGDGAVEVELTGGAEMDSIAEVQFFDAAGQPLEASESGSSRATMAGRVHQISRSYRLKQRPERFGLRLELWTGLLDHQVSVAVQVPAGLGQ